MGSGKTTVAAALAARLACLALDLDAYIAEREGRTPQQIIDEDGEARFRQIESRYLRAAVESHAARIIALGGGAWTIEANRALAAEYGITVWLDAPFDLCWERIAATGADRPFARDRDRALCRYEARRPLYALAPLRIGVTADKSVDDIADEVASALSRAGALG